MLLREILTPRELQYVRLLAEPYGNAEIATIMATTESFVKHKMQKIYEKVGMQEGFSKNRILLAIRYDREVR